MQFWERLNQPRFVAAPMVEYSTLAFRRLVRSFGVDLTYTAMLHSRNFHESKAYRDSHLALHIEDTPCIVQFCGQFAEDILSASRCLESFSARECIKAVDINLGCPQGIAKRGNYGAYLLEQEEKTIQLAGMISKDLNFPLSCKIRKLDMEDLQRTINMALALESAGCKLLTLHGRTKEQKGADTGPCDWEAIKRVKDRLAIPVIGNGGIETREDAVALRQFSGCDASMSAEALLENPALFAQDKVPLEDVCVKYFHYLEECSTDTSVSASRGFMMKMLYSVIEGDDALRDAVLSSDSIHNLKSVVFEAVKKHKNTSAPSEAKATRWYYRHRKTRQQSSAEETTDVFDAYDFNFSDLGFLS